MSSTMTGEPGPFTIRDCLFSGNQDPGDNAIESPGQNPLSYQELRDQITCCVETLNAGGFHRNDRIAIITPGGPETAVAILAVMAGFTAVPLNPQYRETEFESYFSLMKIGAVIAEKGFRTAARSAAGQHALPVIELVPDKGSAGRFSLVLPGLQQTAAAEFARNSDIAYLLLTSGTIDESKVVPVTQKQACISKGRTARALHLTSSDRCLHILPYYHGMGIGTALISTLMTGGTVICTRDFIPPDFPALLQTCRPTHFTAGPALLFAIRKRLLAVPKTDLAGHTLRFIRSTSGTLPAPVRCGLEQALGVPVIDSYGMSEAGTVAINIPQRSGSVGLPLVDALRIIDEMGRTLPAGTRGEIAIQGITVFSGYENAGPENREAFVAGWFRTGDLGYLDCDGYLYLTGRKKELINKGGEKISPLEVDNVLASHPLVREAMAFPVRDQGLGEDIAVLVVPEDPQLTVNEIRRYLLDRLVQFKVPRRIYFVDQLPKNAMGKPLRNVATDQYSGS